MSKTLNERPAEQLAARAAELDDADPLAVHRAAFAGGPRAYFDGNSLGRPLLASRARLNALLDQWEARLIRGWDEGWMDLPVTVGDRIGSVCLGAAPGQTVVGDSTSVLLYKLIRGAVALQPGRDELVLSDDDFPTDRFIAQRIAHEFGLTVRWIRVPRDGGVELSQLEAVLGERSALVLLSHVAYRSAHLADGAALTAAAHAAGALMLWDLSHSVGSVPVELDAWGADLAVGCGYKYLNGGPGAPAFAYVRAGLLDRFRQPIAGWLGAEAPFEMGESYEPAAGARRLLSGTPPVLGLQAMNDMLDLIEAVGMPAVRAKSVALTAFALECAERMLFPLGASLASPADPACRGGHVTIDHPAAREIVARAWLRDVVPDFRAPTGVRIGLSPLSTSFAEVADGVAVIAECVSG